MVDVLDYAEGLDDRIAAVVAQRLGADVRVTERVRAPSLPAVSAGTVSDALAGLISELQRRFGDRFQCPIDPHADVRRSDADLADVLVDLAMRVYRCASVDPAAAGRTFEELRGRPVFACVVALVVNAFFAALAGDAADTAFRRSQATLASAISEFFGDAPAPSAPAMDGVTDRVTVPLASEQQQHRVETFFNGRPAEQVAVVIVLLRSRIDAAGGRALTDAELDAALVDAARAIGWSPRGHLPEA